MIQFLRCCEAVSARAHAIDSTMFANAKIYVEYLKSTWQCTSVFVIRRSREIEILEFGDT